jgi:predicted Fe-Mo cluster-binding NifX family protein
MLTCLATFEERMATLLETASQFRFFDLAGDLPVFMGFSPRPEGGPAGVAALLCGCGSDLLICGAISRAYSGVIKSEGIEVIPWIRGPVQTVLRALARGDLSALAMPGSHPASVRRLRRIIGKSAAPGALPGQRPAPVKSARIYA